MTTETQLAEAPLAVPPPGLRARLSLASEPRRGAVDGGWWPRSRDASSELALLAAALIRPLGWVSRLTVDASDWDEIPRRRITVEGRMIRVGSFPDLNHSIIVTRTRLDTLQLLVVPPGAEPDAAAMALRWAAVGAGSLPPRQILAACKISSVPVRGAGVSALAPAGETPAPDPCHPAAPTITTGTESWGEPAEMGRWMDDGGPVWSGHGEPVGMAKFNRTERIETGRAPAPSYTLSEHGHTTVNEGGHHRSMFQSSGHTPPHARPA